MTFYKLLAEKEKNGKLISAYEKTEKFSAYSSYEIDISKDGLVYETIPTAKTTWKRKFKELTQE